MLTRSRASRKPAAVRRAELVQAALDLMDEEGPEGVTTVAIAARVGLSQAAVFKHFRFKDEIWAAAMDELAARIGPRMAAVDRGPETALERLQLVAQAYLQLAEENPAITAFLFYRVPHTGDRSLRKKVAERTMRLRQLMAKLFREARQAGEIRPDVDVDAAAALLFGIVQGLLVRQHVERRGEGVSREVQPLFTLLKEGLV